MTASIPIFVVPEDTSLANPTIGEIATAVRGQVLHGTSDALNREVRNVKVAAMGLSHFLDRLEPDTLVITPGDRDDIILAAMTSRYTDAYPTVAGLLLSGGIQPSEQVERFLAGLHKDTLPVISVPEDTFTTASLVNGVLPDIAPDNERKAVRALGLFEANVDVEELARRISVARSTTVTPLMFEHQLVARAKSDRRHIVLPEGNDDRVLRAADQLLRRGVVDLTILGDAYAIQERATTLGLDLSEAQIIDPKTSQHLDDFAATYFELRKHKKISPEMAHDLMTDGAYFGTMMVYKGLVDGMVSGAASTTAHTIRPSLEFVKTKPGVSIVSSVFLMCLEDRVLVYGDCAVNPNPSAEQLADIAVSSAETAAAFGVEPRVAMLSYSTGESGKGADVDKVRQATALVRERAPQLKVEGPIQYDAAVDQAVAKSKLPGSEVAGHATVFVFPDLNTGNIGYKAVQRSADAVAIGPVLQGLRKPVNDLSRGCTVPDIVNTVIITAIQAQGSPTDAPVS